MSTWEEYKRHKAQAVQKDGTAEGIGPKPSLKEGQRETAVLAKTSARDRWEAYKKRHQNEATRTGATQHISGEQSKAKNRWEDYLRRKDEDLKVVDADYVNGFLDSAKSFLSSAQTDYEGIGWDNAYDVVSRNRGIYDNLVRQGTIIGRWAEKNRNTLGKDAYAQITGFLGDFTSGAGDVMQAFDDAGRYYDKEKNQDAYAAHVDYQNKLGYDIQTGQQKIDDLNRAEDLAMEINAIAHDVPSYITREYEDILRRYGLTEEDDLEKLITAETVMLNQSKWVQKEAELSSVVDAPDFAQYSDAGAAIKNPSYSDAKGHGYIFGWRPFADEVKNKVTFARENAELFQSILNRQHKDISDFVVDPIYRHVTEKEAAIYNYYLAKYGEEKAEEYLKSIQDKLNQRDAVKVAEFYQGNTFGEILYGWNVGVDQFKSGISALFDGSDYIAPSVAQYAGGMIREDLADNGLKVLGSSLGQIGYDVFSTTANMTPSILSSMAVGMVSKTAGAALGNTLLGASAAGNAYAEKLNAGYSKEQAGGYGVLVGASEVAMEKLLGGITFLGGGALTKTAIKGLDKVDNVLARVAKSTGGKILMNAGSEAFEEGLQSILEPYIWQAVSGEEANVDWEEALYSSLLGFVTGGVFEAGGVPVERAAKNAQALQTYGASQDELVATGLELDPDSNFAQKMQSRLDRGKNLTGAQLNKLVGKNESAMVRNDISSIQKAAETALTKYGETGDIKVISEALAKQAAGKKLSKAERTALSESKYGQRVANEQNPENIQNGDFNTAWAEGIGTERIHAEEYGRLVADAEADLNGAEASVASVKPNAETVESSADVSEAVPTADLTGVDSTNKVEASESTVEADLSASLEQASQKYGAQAKAMVATFNPGQDVASFDRAYGIAYEMGKSGVNMDYAVNSRATSYLTEAQRELAYRQGAFSARETAKSVETMFKGKGATDSGRRKGAVKLDGIKASEFRKMLKDSNDPRGKAAKALMTIAEVTGIDIVLFKSKVDASGRYVGEQGRFEWKDDTIYIDVNAGLFYGSDAGELTKYAMLRTFGHEFTHFLEKNAATQYVEFRKLVFAEMAKNGKNVDYLIQRKQAQYKDQGLSYEAASREVVAESMGDILRDSKFVENLAQKHNGLFKSLLDQLKRFIRNIRSYFNSLAVNSSPEAKALKEEINGTLKYMDSIVEAFDKLAVAAVENYQARTAESEGIVAELTPGEEGVVVDKDGEPVAYSTEDGTVMLSIRTYEEEGRSAFRSYLEKCVTSKKLTKAEMTEMMDGIEEIYTVCKEFKDKYAPFSAWSDAEVIRDTKEKPVFSVVTPNGEYKMNLDFSLVCKKRRALDAVFNEMSKRGIIDDFELGEKTVVKINELIRKKGFETACALCFVDARRFRQADVADSVVKLYNELVSSLVPEEASDKIDHFNFAGYRTVTAVENGIDTWADSELDFSHINEVLEQYGKDTVEAKAARYIKRNPQGRKLLQRGDFMSSGGFDAVKSQNQDIMKLYNSKKGTGGPKAAFGDVQYMNEVISKARWWTPAKAYAVGGVRIQSFSDYVPRMVFDYVQMVYDLAATKLPAHAYTKEALFVKQFGKTGIKINMSLIPKVVEGGVAPGLDANGNYAWAGESFDFETAKEIQQTPGYTENCGTICVGVSDAHIRKLLNDPDIRMVIPYHKSGLNSIVAHMNRVEKFKDYTDFQNTKDAEGKKVEKGYDFNKALREIGDPKAVAQQYLEWCDDPKHGYTPKFAEFRGEENYYKLLIDFTVYDEAGNYVPQREVRAVFPKEGDAFGSMKTLIESGLKEDAVVQGARDAKISDIVDEIERTIPRKEAEISKEEQVEQADHDLEADLLDENRVQKQARDYSKATKNTTDKGGVSYSLRVFEDGKRFVDVQMDAHTFDGMTVAQMNQTAKKILTEKFAGKVVGVDHPVFVNGDSINEYLHPSKSIDIETRKAKLTAAGELDNLLDAGDELPNQPDGRDGHIHPDVIDFSYLTTIFKVGEEYFEGLVNIKNIKRGRLLKDITQIRNITQNIVSSYGQNPKSNFLRDASMDRITDSGENVNRKYLEAVKNGDMETAQRMVDEAAKAAGYTEEVFHGMNHRHNIYKSGNGQYGPGIYFSYDEGTGGSYGKVNDHLYVKVGKIANYDDAYKALGKQDNQSLDEFAQVLGFNSFDEMIEDWDNDPTDVASNPELIELLRNKDFEGFVDEGNDGFVLWDFDGIEYRIKSADPVTYDDNGNVIPLSERFNEENPDIRYSLRTYDDDYAPTFYSQMEKVVSGMKQEKFGASSVVAMLRGRGVKAEEIKWSGIEEWLAGKKSVTKAELHEFIAGSMLQIEEDMLTDKEIPYSQEHLDQIAKYEAERDIIAENLKSEWKRIVGTDIPITNFGTGLESAVVHSLLEANATKKGNTDAGYKYKAKRAALQRVIEDGEHYFGFDNARQAFREAARNPNDFMNSYEMTSFEKGVFRDFIKAKEAYKKVEGISVEDQRTLKAIAESADRFSNRIHNVKTEHRTEAAKYLTKYRGYTVKGGTNYREMLFRLPGATYSNGAMYAHWERSGVLAHARMQDLNTFLGKMLFIEEIQSDWHNEGRKTGYEGVPDAPFRDNYHEFVLKKLIRMAAEQGYDSIGWTTADIQSERWSDEFAEGYRIEYDQDIPKFLNKYGKKWGTKVGKTVLDSGIEVWSMAITDSMKESVLYEGQAQYQLRTNTLTDHEILDMAAKELDSSKLTEGEKAALDIFQKRVSTLKALKEERQKQGSVYYEAQFGENRDKAKASAARNRMSVLDKQITRASAEVLSLEDKKVLKDVLQKSRKVIEQHERKASLNAIRAAREETRARERMRADERIEALRQKKNERIAEVRAEEREKASERVQNVREGYKSSKLREKIRAFKSKLEKNLLQPTERQYVPAGLAQAMIDVVNLIDIDTALINDDGTVNKAQERRDETRAKLSKLADEYDRLKASDPVYAGEFDETVHAYLKELRDNFEGRHLQEMTFDELSEMYDILRSIEETLQDARKLIGWGDAATVYEAGEAIIAEQANITAKRKGGQRTSAQEKRDNSLALTLSPVRFVERMVGYNQDSYLLKMFRAFEKGVRKKNFFKMQAYKSFESLTSRQQYEDAIYKPVGKTYTDANGRSFRLSKMQMMQAILSLEREHANDMSHIAGSGFSFADLDMLSKGKLKNAISEEHSHRVPNAVEMVGEFNALLENDKWAQNYMAAARRFFNETAKDAINETSLALKHRIIAKDKSYIPFEVDRNFIVNEISAANDVQQTINSYGMLKDTKKFASNPLIITGLNNILDRHIEQVGNVYGLAIEIRNFNKVWNVRGLEASSSDPTVKASIQRNWGDKGKGLVEQAVQDIQGPRINNQSDIYKKVKSGYIGATFLLNLSVVTKQIGSMYAATSMLKFRGPIRQIGNLLYTMTHSKKLSAEVDKYTASAWMRRQGLSDAEIYTLMTEGKRTWLGRFTAKWPAVLNPAKWITGMDHAVALSLWKYAKEDTAKRTGLKGEALLEAAAEFYDQVIENTQSMTDMLHRPEIQKRSDVISESFGMFKTDLYQTAGQLLNTWERNQALHTKETEQALRRTLYSVTMSVVWAQLMTSVFALLRYKVNPYRDDENKDLTVESWLKKQGFSLLGDVAGYIFPLLGSEIVGTIENAVYGESGNLVDSIGLTAINNAYDAIIKVCAPLANGELPKESEWRKVTGNVLQMFGIPANNILRTLDAIGLHAKDIANGRFFSFEAGVKRTASHHAHRIMEAVEKGNMELAQELYAEATEGVALKKSEDGSISEDALKDAKSSLQTAVGKKFKAGEMSRAVAEKILTELFGSDEDDVYWTIKAWESGADSRYSAVFDAALSGKGFNEALKEMLDHGYEKEDILSELKSQIGTWYTDKESEVRISKQEATNMLSKYVGMKAAEVTSTVNQWTCKVVTGIAYGKIKEEFLAGRITASRAIDMRVRYGGKSKDDATAEVDGWIFEKKYGFSYSNKKAAYINGDVSASELRNLMVTYGGMTTEEADESLRVYDWMKQHPSYGLTESEVEAYIKPIAALGYSVEQTGIDPDVFKQYKALAGKAKGVDANGDGKADSGTVKAEIMEAIDRLPISNSQKDALYYSNGWAKSKLWEAPWH